MTAGDKRADWWNTDDVSELTNLLTGGMRSGLWQHTEPGELAAWVFDTPQTVPLLPAPAVFGGDWRDGLNQQQQLSWALAGWVLRTAVPKVEATAGKHWLLSRVKEKGLWRLRLTVGRVALFRLNERGDEVRLRLALAPLYAAFQAGALSDEDWEDRGISRPDDTTRTLEKEKILLCCPDVATALWLLKQPPVMVAARMLAARLATTNFSFARSYRSEVSARAWAAAESLRSGATAAPGGPRGFDRSYTSPTAPADLPTQRSFNRDSYQAGVDEHDRLCRALIDQLAAAGVQAGAGLSGVPVDLAWRDAEGKQFIAEVKSVFAGNEVEQLRLGLGQVLEYRHRLAALNVPVRALLVVPRALDPGWRDICADNGVTLIVADRPGWAAELAATSR